MLQIFVIWTFSGISYGMVELIRHVMWVLTLPRRSHVYDSFIVPQISLAATFSSSVAWTPQWYAPSLTLILSALILVLISIPFIKSREPLGPLLRHQLLA